MPNVPINKAQQQVKVQAKQQPEQKSKQEAAGPTWKDYIQEIHYSDRYSDDLYEYRHVILPKPLLEMIPVHFFQDPQSPEVLRLLKEEEWRGIGIAQSRGWEHYEVHAPEPHVLLFRRTKDFVPPQK